MHLSDFLSEPSRRPPAVSHSSGFHSLRAGFMFHHFSQEAHLFYITWQISQEETSATTVKISQGKQQKHSGCLFMFTSAWRLRLPSTLHLIHLLPQGTISIDTSYCFLTLSVNSAEKGLTSEKLVL